METDVKEKLKNILRKESYTEQDITYFFVESYKLLEQKNKKEEFNLIVFFRNWICHAYLKKDSEKIFDEVYILIRAKKYLDDETWEELITQAVMECFGKYSFHYLYEQIKSFIAEYLDNEAFNWEDLRVKLYEVIQDIPLLITENGQELFKFQCAKFPERVSFDHFKFKFSVVVEGKSETIIGPDSHFVEK